MQGRQRLDHAHGRRPVRGVRQIGPDRAVAQRLGQKRALRLEAAADAQLGPPGHAADLRLKVVLGTADADAVQALGREACRDCAGPARQLHQLVVGGVVALGDRLVQQVADRGLEALLADVAGDRLVEDAAVLRRHQHGVAQVQPPPVHLIQHLQGRPGLRHALLREQVLGVDTGDPAGPDVGHGDADRFLVARGELGQLLLQSLRGGGPSRLGLARRDARGRLRSRGLGRRLPQPRNRRQGGDEGDEGGQRQRPQQPAPAAPAGAASPSRCGIAHHAGLRGFALIGRRRLKP